MLPQSYQYIYPNLSEGADRVGGQLRGDKECLFSGVTKSGRVWRKVPESDTRSVPQTVLQKELVVTKGSSHVRMQCIITFKGRSPIIVLLLVSMSCCDTAQSKALLSFIKLLYHRGILK